MDRPQSKMRKPELLYIVGCEGKNQECLYFEKIKQIINNIPARKFDIIFDYAEPFGGDPKCVVERTLTKSIGKENKISVFDFDNKKVKYEEALELAKANYIDLANTNFCFDLWLILHKEDYFISVSDQDCYDSDIKRIYGLPNEVNIKKKNNVEKIIEQITFGDIKDAIKRAEEIDKLNKSVIPNITPKKIKYYNNPDTNVHKALKNIFKKAGIKLALAEF